MNRRFLSVGDIAVGLTVVVLAHAVVLCPNRSRELEKHKPHKTPDEIQVSIEVSEPLKQALAIAPRQEDAPPRQSKAVERPLSNEQAPSAERPLVNEQVPRPERKQEEGGLGEKGSTEPLVSKNVKTDRPPEEESGQGGSTEALVPTMGASYRIGTAKNPRPSYPPSAFFAGIEGEVVLTVDVLASGSVGQVGVLESSGSEVLDKAALETVAKWQFEPARRQGIAIRQRVTIPINFSLRRQ